MSRLAIIKSVGIAILIAFLAACIQFTLQAGRGRIVTTEAVSVDKPQHIVAIGDVACPPLMKPSQTECFSPNVAALVLKRQVDALLLLGDLQYEKGDLADFQKSYDKDWGALRDVSYASLGNHEYATAKASGYFSYWNGSASTSKNAGETGKGYYSFDIGKWHLIALNSNCEYVSGCDVGSAQHTWLKTDLEKSKAKCVLAFWHHPVFTSGKYLHNSDSNSRGLPFWRLVDGRAAVILNGHDHIYQRFEPQNNLGMPQVGSPTEFIVGTGGRRLYKLLEQPKNGYATDDTYGYLELSLAAESYQWWFKNLQNQVIDSGASECPS